MRLIPGKTKVKIELFKGVSLVDGILGAMGLALTILLIFSTLPFRFYFAGFIAMIFIGLLFRVDDEPNYLFLLRIIKHMGMKKHYQKVVEDKMLVMISKKRDKDKIVDDLFDILNEDEYVNYESGKVNKDKEKTKKDNTDIKSSVDFSDIKDIIPFTGIKDNCIEYAGQYYGAAIEIDPIEFRFFSPHRKRNTIENGVGKVLRNISPEYASNIVKIDRPINYENYLKKEYEKLDELRSSYESGLITEEELKPRVEILYDHINKLIKFVKEDPVIAPFYYIVLFDSDKRQLEIQVDNALDSLEYGEMKCRRLDNEGLALFLKYTNELDFNEKILNDLTVDQYADFAMPDQVDVKAKQVMINNICTHNFRITGYSFMVGDAWLASVMSMPSTKVVVKCTPMERLKAVKIIDKSLQELRVQLRATGLDSKAMEIQGHIESLEGLLATLQRESENLIQVNVYITAYDLVETNRLKEEKDKIKSNRNVIGNMRKSIRRLYRENNLRLVANDFQQIESFVGSQISGYDPFLKEGRGMPSNSVAACYPWVFASVSDVGGVEMGTSEGIPVFIDFFRRDYERLNSNMVIVGKSGSGKSYATKDILSNLAAENSKIFILDPENEYSDLASNLNGKFINVGNARQGRINPFHIITALDDDESLGSITGSYATHLQFLEEFFKQILPDCDKDALEYLNNLVDRMYYKAGIDEETDLSKLKPEDYPIFDSLYDIILEEFQNTENEYIRNNLRTLMNYVAKFSSGGRNANIWNGPSTITTEENFIVFNFQSLLSNRNSTIANAQMLLVLKYIDNEIIKNREYNTKYGLNRKIVVAIDEAHVFIDSKYPTALDFMFQLAKRIRKYNGMQIVITQNIKDFVGSEEIARKSTAIINACQYSFIFSLAPNDMHDLCTLYEKAGGINEIEQERITTAPRGQAFTVLGPTSRTTFKVEVPKNTVELFESKNYESKYFFGDKGERQWEEFISESRTRRAEIEPVKEEINEDLDVKVKRSAFTFSEITEEEARSIKKKSGFTFTEEKVSETVSLPNKDVSSDDDLDFDFDFDLEQGLANEFDAKLDSEFDLELDSEFDSELDSDLDSDFDFEIDSDEAFELEEDFEFKLDEDDYDFNIDEEFSDDLDEDNVTILDDEDDLDFTLDDDFDFKLEDDFDFDFSFEDDAESLDEEKGHDDELKAKSEDGDLNYDTPTRIEMMEENGEMVIDISLDELIRFIKKNNYN